MMKLSPETCLAIDAALSLAVTAEEDDIEVSAVYQKAQKEFQEELDREAEEQMAAEVKEGN